jgi:hypothetical protein
MAAILAALAHGHKHEYLRPWFLRECLSPGLVMQRRTLYTPMLAICRRHSGRRKRAVLLSASRCRVRNALQGRTTASRVTIVSLALALAFLRMTDQQAAIIKWAASLGALLRPSDQIKLCHAFVFIMAIPV